MMKQETLQVIENAGPAELLEIVGQSYVALMLRVVEGKATGEELSGVETALANGWRVRIYHDVTQGQISAELARDGETAALFECDPNAGTRH